MILSDKKILEAIEENQIVIEPFRRKSLGTNSYDVHLGRWLAVYEDTVLDARAHNRCATWKFRMRALCCSLPLYILVSRKSHREHTIQCHFWRERAVWVALASISTLRLERAMWVSVTTGRLRSLACSPCARVRGYAHRTADLFRRGRLH
jgi:hypothetical protein